MSQKITYAELPFLYFAAITNDIHKAQINLRFRFSYLRFRKIKENYMLNFHTQKSKVVFLIHTFFHVLNVATRLNSCLESLCNYSQVITPFHLRYHVHQNLLHNTISSKEAEQEVTWDRYVCVCVCVTRTCSTCTLYNPFLYLQFNITSTKTTFKTATFEH